MTPKESSGYIKSYQNSFRIGMKNIEKISAILEKNISLIEEPSQIRFYIEREDNSFFETNEIEKILYNENTKGRLINKLSISLRKIDSSSEKGSMFAAIIFDKKKDEKISIVASNESDEWCKLIFDELDIQAKRIFKNRFILDSSIKYIDLAIGIIGMFTIFSFRLNKIDGMPIDDLNHLLQSGVEEKINYLVEKHAIIDTSFSSHYYFIWIFAVLFMFSFVIFEPTKKILKRLNISAFYWGDMEEIYDKEEKNKEQIKWLAISLILPAIFAFAYNYFGYFVSSIN